MSSERWPRRIVLFGALLLLLVPFGLYPLLTSWSGESGRRPVRRLYVPGAFAANGLLLELHATRREEGLCYHVLEPRTRAHPDSTPICSGEHRRTWVGDGQIEVVIGTDDVPTVSLSGAQLRPGDWIGSNANPDARDPVRFPLRGYGIPGRAAQVVMCGPNNSHAGATPAGCVRVHDRLGRLAIAPAAGVRSGGALPANTVYPLYPGDELWLGLVPFRVSARRDGSAGLVLEREDRVRGETTGTRATGPVTASGGDRRWLGRLWAAERPEREGPLPIVFQVLPADRLFTKRNLARRRTSLEVEDVVQEMIDAELLCLESGGHSPQVAWRPVDAPGCDTPAADQDVRRAVDEQLRERYRRTRWGDMAPTTAALVNGTNASLTGSRYLLDVSSLPLAFDWRLRWRNPAAREEVGLLDAQPVARALWGVRFGSTRFNDEPRPAPALPAVFLRTSTARYVVQALQGDEVISSFSLAGAQGRLCWGIMGGTPIDGSSGNHHPLGAFAFGSNPRVGVWNADPTVLCGGCSVDLRPATATASGRGAVALRAGSGCGALHVRSEKVLVGREIVLRDGDSLQWSVTGLRLRVVDRGERAWTTLPGTGGRRRFVDEFYRRGGLAPLLGDPGGLRGIEAALRDFGAASETGSALPPLELSVDGDLQIAVQSIVDTMAAGADAFAGEAPVAALVLDARTGEVLAVANSRSGASLRPPSAWEAGAQLTRGLENSAFQRRRPLGSTLKIVGAYALVNSGLPDGAAPSATRPGWAVAESRQRDSSFLFVARQRSSGTGPASARKCTAGTNAAHLLPAADGAFNRGTLVQRFAQSCNSFFIMTGFRHAGHATNRLRAVSSATPPLVRGELGMLGGARDTALLLLPARPSVADQVREGLSADLVSRGGIPRSIYGLLVRSGFQPWPGGVPRDPRPSSFTFLHARAPVTVPLAAWFAPAGPGAFPSLLPGRDFSYPRIPSPGQLDALTSRTATIEKLGRHTENVRRDTLQGEPEVQYAQLLIGQGQVEGSALALSVLYSPAVRADGRTVHPCVFRSQCRPGRTGAAVLDRGSPAAAALDSALRAVLTHGTAAKYFRMNRWAGLRNRWGGKTGTYEQETATPAERGRRLEWERLVEWGCGIVSPLAARPDVSGLSQVLYPGQPAAVAAAARVAASDPGDAWGARACEDPARPLNPAGIQTYGAHQARWDLDAVAAGLRETAVRSRGFETHHAFVLAGIAGSGRAEGVVIAVLVDNQQVQAVPIGAEIALAVDRWTEVSRR